MRETVVTSTYPQPQSSPSFNLYPNPAIDHINVEKSNIYSSYSISTTNGHVELKGELNNTTESINLKDLSDGIYLFTVFSDNATRTFKIVVNRN